MASDSAPMAPDVPASLSSGSDSDFSLSDDEPKFDLQALQKAVQENPQDFAAHIALVNAIRVSGGDVHALRHARHKFAEAFPLPPHMWKQWIEDELRISSTSTEKILILQRVFPKALEDYLSLDLHHMRLDLSIELCKTKQIDAAVVRKCFSDSCARGAVAVVEGGEALWEKYRTFMYSGGEASSHVLSPEKQMLEGHVFLLEDSERIRQDCDVFETKLKQKLPEIEEHQLGQVPEDITMLFRSYAEYAKTVSQILALSVYERCIALSFLNPSIWLEYIRYCQTVNNQLVYPVCHRATRNVPWALEVWASAVLFVPEANDTSLSGSKQEEFISILRRVKGYVMVSSDMHGAEFLTKACWTSSLALQNTDETLEWVSSTLGFNVSGTAQWASAQCYAATVLRALGKSARAISLLEEVVSSRPFEAHWWLWYANLLHDWKESDADAVRELYRRAMLAVSSAAEVRKLSDAWMQFEVAGGSHTTPLTQRVASVYSLAGAQHSRLQALSGLQRSKNKPEARQRGKTQTDNTRRRNLPKRKRNKSDGAPRSAVEHEKQDMMGGDSKQYPVQTVDMAARDLGNDTETPQTLNGKAAMETPEAQSGRKALLSKREPEKGASAAKGESEVEPKTIFINNLAFNVSDTELRAEFDFAGKIEQVRILRRSDGASRGIAYMQFENDECVEKALQKHLKPIKGRSVWVRRSKPPQRKAKKAKGSGSPRHTAKSHPAARGPVWQLQPRSVKRKILDTQAEVGGKDGDVKMTDGEAEENGTTGKQDDDRQSVPKTQDDFRAMFLSKQ